jgi:hypothetical protein
MTVKQISKFHRFFREQLGLSRQPLLSVRIQVSRKISDLDGEIQVTSFKFLPTSAWGEEYLQKAFVAPAVFLEKSQFSW